ncbi:MAG TPA: hypothetical protein VND15_02490 [Candidatus Acidoferrales bacterium]|nr:hypothetical protein [Candidatus Acidoferrales bacterium]
MGMRKVRALMARAVSDLELGERYARLKEDAVASLLYRKAREKVLKALFISRTKREPPTNVSVRYLAGKVRMPADITAEISNLEEEEDEPVAAYAFDADSYGRSRLSYESAKNRVTSRYRTTKRLVYYAMAAVKA